MARHIQWTDLPSVPPQVITLEQETTASGTMDSSREIYSVSTTTVSRPCNVTCIRLRKPGYE